jgi:uncharacterized membrane protein YgdD (TMEM256/DUF423 family)
MHRLWIVLGALAGLSAVAMAAFAAHGPLDGGSLALVRNALQMHGWHALALVGVGLWAARARRPALAHLAGLAFAAGLLGFCGAIYLLALPGIHVPALAPVGGTLLMLGWLLLAISGIAG